MTLKQSRRRDRRLKHIRLTGEFITSLFVEGNEIHQRVVEGLPEDAEFRRLEYYGSFDYYMLIVWSSEFEVVHEGAVIPEAQVSLKDVEEE